MSINLQKPILALDIDDTLADTAGHFAVLLHDRFGNPEGLTPTQIIDKYHAISVVPYWQTPEIVDWRIEQGLNNDTQQSIPVTPESVTVVKKLAEHFDFLYISSRPTAVEFGTAAWLLKNGFPQGELILRNKEFQLLNGNAWKAQILTERYPNVVGIVEDNPEIITQFNRHYKGVIYLYGKATYQEAPEITVRKCLDWNAVYSAVMADLLAI